MSPRQVGYLIKHELIRPSVRRGGQGAASELAFAELLLLSVIARVREVAGTDVRLQRLRSIVEVIERHEGPFEGQLLCVDAVGAWMEPADLLDAVASRRCLLVLSLSGVEADLRRSLGQAGMPAVVAPRAA